VIYIKSANQDNQRNKQSDVNDDSYTIRIEQNGDGIELAVDEEESACARKVAVAAVSVGDASQFRWKDKSIFDLIQVYKDHLQVITKSNLSKKIIWQLISGKLREKGHVVSDTQVQSKWKNLCRHYRNPPKNYGSHSHCPVCVELEGLVGKEEETKIKCGYSKKKKPERKMPPRKSPRKKRHRTFSNDDDDSDVSEVEGVYSESEQEYDYDSDTSFVCDAPNKQWPRKAEIQLISLYKKYKNLMKLGRDEKWNAWKMITKELNAAGNRFTEHQAKSKWGSLSYTYNVSASLQTDYPYAKEMADALGSSSSSSTLAMQSASNDVDDRLVASNSRSSSGDADNATKRKSDAAVEVTENSGSSRKVKNRRKYNDDIIESLRSMHEECIREEQATRDLAKQMHEEKLQVMNTFIDLLRELVDKT